MEWQLENLKIVHFTWVHSPVMQKTLQIPLFLTRWTERGLNPRPKGYKPPGGGLSLIVSGNARIQPLAYSLLKQEELQLA